MFVVRNHHSADVRRTVDDGNEVPRIVCGTHMLYMRHEPHRSIKTIAIGISQNNVANNTLRVCGKACKSFGLLRTIFRRKRKIDPEAQALTNCQRQSPQHSQIQHSKNATQRIFDTGTCCDSRQTNASITRDKITRDVEIRLPVTVEAAVNVEIRQGVGNPAVVC